MSGLGNKEIMAKNIKHYMDLNGKERNDLCKDLEFNYSTLTDWINGNTYPRIDKIELMANYFRIEKSDLIENKSETQEKEYYLNEDARDMAQFLYDNPDYKVLFDASRKVKAEDINFVKQMLDKFKSE